MKRPKRKILKVYYFDYNECADFIKHKYAFSDYAMNKFWQWIRTTYYLVYPNCISLPLGNSLTIENEVIAEVFECFQIEFKNYSDNNFQVKFYAEL